MRAALILAGLALAWATPAGAEPYGPPDDPAIAAKEKREERAKNRKAMVPGIIASNLLDLADIVTTHECSKSPRCYEANSIYGSRNPSLGTIVAIKGHRDGDLHRAGLARGRGGANRWLCLSHRQGRHHREERARQYPDRVVKRAPIEFVITTCRAGIVRLSRKGSYCNMPMADDAEAAGMAELEADGQPFTIERQSLRL